MAFNLPALPGLGMVGGFDDGSSMTGHTDQELDESYQENCGSC